MTDQPVFNLDPNNTMPRHKGWISLTEAARRLGVSRQHAYKMARDGKFGKSIERIGDAHMAIVKEVTVTKMVEKRAEKSSAE